uniref:Uncharacterized protein n=1 Tax=Arabidopsis thaliana TaxID=3702 RepID=Q8GYA9_ARATH|nr:unknown protein [Arabidopsis thaliana]
MKYSLSDFKLSKISRFLRRTLTHRRQKQPMPWKRIFGILNFLAISLVYDKHISEIRQLGRGLISSIRFWTGSLSKLTALKKDVICSIVDGQTRLNGTV